ncbi:MAG: hypothetical protein ACE5JM_08695 [Armatimonadota bacterium]
MRLHVWLKTVCVVSACVLVAATTAYAQRFSSESYWCHHCEHSHGVVKCNGGPVFVVAHAGGYTGPERGEIIAGRLNDLFTRWRLSPDDIRVTRQRGEWVVVASRPSGGEADLLATADARMAMEAKIEGHEEADRAARAKRLASWWAVLLKDQIRLAQGQPPAHTAGCMIHATLSAIHKAAPSGDADALRSAVAELAPDQAECLSHCASVVPRAFGSAEPQMAHEGQPHGAPPLD